MARIVKAVAILLWPTNNTIFALSPRLVTTLGFALFSLAVPQAPSVHWGLFTLAEQNHTSCPSAATAAAAAPIAYPEPGTKYTEDTGEKYFNTLRRHMITTASARDDIR